MGSSVGWDDLVLPSSQKATLREIASQLRYRRDVYDRWGFGSRSNRGLGLCALFAGPSGTCRLDPADPVVHAYNLLMTDLHGTVGDGRVAAVLVRRRFLVAGLRSYASGGGDFSPRSPSVWA